ncbi:hypothetical protein ABN702_22560 [Bacillus haimaensis]|uniref:hypothetical protein n=1 Tax=Bacillus haimaensis TaxID=3160967 RepID=UPI003AA84038
MLDELTEFFHLQRDGYGDYHSISSEELEGMLTYITENNRQFDSFQVRGELDPFYRVLEKTNGQLNTLLLFEFDEKKEPTVKDLVLLTNDAEENWMLLQNGPDYNLVKGSSSKLEAFMMESDSPKTTEEKESVL